MEDRRKQYPDAREEGDATIERVQSCKNLGGIRWQRADGTHSGQDHACIQKGIDPIEDRKMVVSDHAGQHGKSEEAQSHSPMFRQTQ